METRTLRIWDGDENGRPALNYSELYEGHYLANYEASTTRIGKIFDTVKACVAVFRQVVTSRNDAIPTDIVIGPGGPKSGANVLDAWSTDPQHADPPGQDVPCQVWDFKEREATEATAAHSIGELKDMDKQRKIIFPDGHEEVVRFVDFDRKFCCVNLLSGLIRGAYDHYSLVTDNATYHLKIFKNLEPIAGALLTDAELPSIILLKENKSCEFPELPANGKPDCEKWRFERRRSHTVVEETRLQSMVMKRDISEAKVDLPTQSNTGQKQEVVELQSKTKKILNVVLSGQKPTETVKPEAKPIVTFSSDFLTVNCNVWKKSESRERKRQANTMLRKLYKNYKRGNKPIPVGKILKGISTERIEKLLNKTRYPQTFSLICQKTEEKTGKRTISLSDDYEYRAE